MNLISEIILGIFIGLVISFFYILKVINNKEKELLAAWNNLYEILNMRYLKLKNLLNILRKYMTDFQPQVDNLLELCNSALEDNSFSKSVIERLKIENSINMHLEEIKSNMEKYPLIQQDLEIESSITAIIQSESAVGEAIQKYNSKHIEYKFLLEAFPISIVAAIMNRSSNGLIPFVVSQVEEFDDSWIDEDEI